MTPLLVAVVLCADGSPPPARLLSNEVSAGLGFLGASYTTLGSRVGDTLLTPTLAGRAVVNGFTVDGGLYLAAPLEAGGLATSYSWAVRLGWTGRRWSAVAGATMTYTPGARPAVSMLPSLLGQYDFGPLGLALGVFDQLGLVPAHLSARMGRFSIGWVAPVGLLASADLPLPDGFGLRFSGFAFRLGNTEMAMLTIAATWGGAR